MDSVNGTSGDYRSPFSVSLLLTETIKMGTVNILSRLKVN